MKGFCCGLGRGSLGESPGLITGRGSISSSAGMPDLTAFTRLSSWLSLSKEGRTDTTTSISSGTGVSAVRLSTWYCLLSSSTISHDGERERVWKSKPPKSFSSLSMKPTLGRSPLDTTRIKGSHG